MKIITDEQYQAINDFIRDLINNHGYECQPTSIFESKIIKIGVNIIEKSLKGEDWTYCTDSYQKKPALLENIIIKLEEALSKDNLGYSHLLNDEEFNIMKQLTATIKSSTLK